MGPYHFRKNERLTSKKQIARLFDRQKQDGHVKCYPFVFTWKVERLGTEVPAQVVFVASKKSLPKANHRSRVKRQMRELYRYRKGELYQLLISYNKQVILAIIYTGNELKSFSIIEEQFDKAFEQLQNSLKASFQSFTDRPDNPL